MKNPYSFACNFMKSMKYTFLLLLALLPHVCFSQLNPIAESSVFEEPENGYAKILLLENGNTAYLHITKKEGINVRIYNESHQEIVNKELTPSYGKLKGATVNGIYDAGGNIVAFISEYDEKTPTLYRLIINSKTGDLVETKTIATLMKANMGQGYAMAFGGVPMPEFLVRKDPYSDNYAVVRYNTFVENREERVELIQYGETGAEVYRTFLASPDAKYKYTQILDFVLIGSDAYALLYSYNTPKSGGAANELLLATVKNGTVSYQNLGKSMSRRINDGLLRYNPTTGNLIFITLELLNTEFSGFNKKVSNYAIQFNIIDPKNPSITKSVDIRRSAASLKYKKIFKDDEPFSGMPQQVYINDDGSFTLLLEEITHKYRSNSNGIPGTPTSSTPIGCELGSTVIATYNENGTEKSSLLIPKLHTFVNSAWDQKDYVSIPNFYIADRDNKAVPLSGGNQYKSFVYLHSKTKPYVLMNDVAENEERILKGKLTNVKGVGDCEGYMYDLTATPDANGILPRTLAFNKAKSKDRNLAIFSISDYNRNKQLYATLKLEKGKGVKVVWLKE